MASPLPLAANQVRLDVPQGWDKVPFGKDGVFQPQAHLKKKPVVLLCVPFDRDISGPCHTSIVNTMRDPTIEVRPMTFPGTVIHLSRSQMIEAARKSPDVDFLLMHDSDQTYHHLMVRRLVAWNKPMVAPVITQRLGDAIPVCYRAGRDADGKLTGGMEPLLNETALYLRQFHPKWYQSNGGTVVLPLKREYDDPNLFDPPATEEQRRELEHPLLECDAVGTGMVLIRRDVLLSLEPDERGLYCFFHGGGGEDFDLCRRIKAKGWSIFVDRGCVAGHLVWYARGAWDLLNLYESAVEQAAAAEAEAAKLPPANPDLVDELNRRNGQNGHTEGRTVNAEWQLEPLPGEALAAAAG